MKLIKRLSVYLETWRQRTEGVQYQSGYDWVYIEYYHHGHSLKQVIALADMHPRRSHFDRGVMQAVLDIKRDEKKRNITPEPEFNLKGEPVDVPFFIGTRGELAECERVVMREMIDPEKEKAAKKVEEDQGFRSFHRLHRGYFFHTNNSD